MLFMGGTKFTLSSHQRTREGPLDRRAVQKIGPAVGMIMRNVLGSSV